MISTRANRLKSLMTILTPNQIADTLNKSIRWNYDNGKALGGVRIGGSWFFTKEGLENAIMGQSERNLERTSQISRKKISAGLSNQKGSQGLGATKTKRTARSGKDHDRNRHGLGGIL